MKDKAQFKWQGGFPLAKVLTAIMLINGPAIGLLSGLGDPKLGHPGGISGAMFGLTFALWISIGVVSIFGWTFDRIHSSHFAPIVALILFPFTPVALLICRLLS